MADYSLLVDGERVMRVKTEEEVRAWLATYREEHVEDDPSAAHVQIVQRGKLAWLTGGKVLDRLKFL
jgi:hypothetical protein